MKAAMCTTCSQVIGPRPRWETDRAWTWCAGPCAHTAVRWRDGAKGLLEVSSFHGPEGVAVIGLHNGFIAGLGDGVGALSDAGWRRLHETVTQLSGRGYLFDQARRSCWAVLVRVGQSNDVFFIDYGEARSESDA